jgi:arsenite methyltransferase
MPPRFVSRQLSHPTGWAGRVFGWLMNRHNARMNAFAVRQLALDPSQRVLEIGFGGGVALPPLMRGAGFVCGVDRSKDTVAWARARFANAVRAGRAEFVEGRVEELPFEAASFGRVLTVNTVYFWRSLDAGFAQIHRVLAPGGRLALGFLPKEWMDRMGHPADIFTPRTSEELVAALAHAGFRRVRVERPEPATKWGVIVAIR